MDYSVKFDTGKAVEREDDLLVFFVSQYADGEPDLEEIPSLPDNPLSRFDAESSESRVFYDGEFSSNALALVGLGEPDSLEPSDIADVAGNIPSLAEEESASEVSVVFPMFLDEERTEAAKFLGLGLDLGGYEFENFKTDGDEEDDDEKSRDENLERITLLLEDRRSLSTVQQGYRRARDLSTSISFSRNLANTPANHLVPEDLAEKARGLADEHSSISVDVWDEEDLENDDMNLILAVGKGSENPPRLIKLEYDPDLTQGTVGLLGKGVTFDTGGISIKPSKKMGEMKFDMCGAATVLGVFKACARQELPIHVHGLVPTAENMVGESAVKPGDVVTGYHGKSVEILNTDAEGRLLLADALGYASDQLAQELDCMIDFATLTGSCITALGHHAAGLMGIDGEICEALQEAGRRTDEPAWELPLWGEYSEELESSVADVSNIGGDAGAITAGAFLREFVDEDAIERWAHLDIAGTGWSMPERSYRPSGGTGYGVHLIDEFLRDEFALDH